MFDLTRSNSGNDLVLSHVQSRTVTWYGRVTHQSWGLGNLVASLLVFRSDSINYRGLIPHGGKLRSMSDLTW